MTIDIKTLLTNSFVISIDNNRLNRFYRIFSHYNLNTPLPKHYYGFNVKSLICNNTINKKWPDSAIKTSLSHASLVRLAQSLNLPFVCIFEDDAYPSKTIINDLTSVLTDLPDDIDILRLGWQPDKAYQQLPIPPAQQNISHFLTKVNAYGGHAYIIFNKYYDRYHIRFSKCCMCDQYPINSQCLNIYCSKKCLFVQNNNFSEHCSTSRKSITSHDIKYNININDYDFSIG